MFDPMGKRFAKAVKNISHLKCYNPGCRHDGFEDFCRFPRANELRDCSGAERDALKSTYVGTKCTIIR